MSSDTTPRLGLPDMPETPELYPDIVADAFARLDAFTDLYLKGQFVNTPPSAPADGDAYLVGGAPTGGWSGYAYKIAACRDGAWVMLTPFNGLRAFVAATGACIVYADGVWTDAHALIGAGEASIASAATCDIGAAGALFVAVTGTTTITGFGTAANRLRFVRFAQSLTLTHHATSLVLPGGANIVTAAGDMACFTSDGSGNWRCRHYARADGRMVNMASPAFTGTMTAASANFSGAIAAGPSTFDGNVRIQRSPTTSEAYYRITNGAGDTYIGADNSAASGFGIAGAYGTVVWRPNATAFALSRTSSVDLYVSSTGNVGFGTTTDGGVTTDARVAVQQNAAGNAFTAYQQHSAGNAQLNCVDNTGSALIKFRYTSVDVGAITTNGTTTTYGTTSDTRLKAVCAAQRDWRDAIRALWVGEFDKYSDFTRTGRASREFGILAQQAHGALGGLGVSAPAQEDGVWMASSEPFAFLALWGVKDLYATVEALSARVAALEAAHAG